MAGSYIRRQAEIARCSRRRHDPTLCLIFYMKLDTLIPLAAQGGTSLAQHAFEVVYLRPSIVSIT
jgi:hypothetical protein